MSFVRLPPPRGFGHSRRIKPPGAREVGGLTGAFHHTSELSTLLLRVRRPSPHATDTLPGSSTRCTRDGDGPTGTPLARSTWAIAVVIFAAFDAVADSRAATSRALDEPAKRASDHANEGPRVESPATSDAEVHAPHEATPTDHGNADAPDDDEVIVVTGTKSETPLSASPVVTEVIDRKRLEESGVQTVGEALTLRPGLWVDRGVAGTTGITIQGLGPQYSLVLVDGTRQIGRTDGYLDLDRFGVEDIEQIEIVRGPSSALYGADALGGVVNIITRRAKDGFAVDAIGHLDGRHASDVRARLAYGSGGIGGAIAGTLRRGDPVRRGDAADVGTTLDGYEDRHVTARGVHQKLELWRFDGSVDYLWRDMRGVDANAAGAVFDRRNLVENATAQASAQYGGDRTALRVSADASVYRDQYLYDQRMSDALDEYQVTDEHLVEGSAQVIRQLGQHRALVGGEVLREGLDSDRLAMPGVRTRGAVFAQDEWRLLRDDQLLVVPAARVDVDTQFGTHVTPRLAARWQASERVVVRGSLGMGYRAPGFKELLLHFANPSVGYVVDGNPDLQPETSRSAQLGGEWQATSWLWVSANGFNNGLSDLITAVTLPDDGSGTLEFGYDNIGRARTAGFEGYAMATRGRAGLELGYALTRARDLDAERSLESVPAHRFTATLRWRDRKDGFDAFAAVVVTGHRPFYLGDDPQVATLTARRVELRARIAKRFQNGLGGFLGADNLLDAGDAGLDRILPRTFYAGVEMHL